MADANEQQTETTETSTAASSANDLIPRSEAQKAFLARDKAKKELEAMSKRALSEEAIAEYESLKAAQAQAEEDRKKKAGEFETLKQSLITKHTTELETERAARLQLEADYKTEKIEAAFLGAVDLFGGHDKSATILTGDMATAYLGKYVAFEEVEIAGKTIKAVVVRDLDGQIILDGKGNPAKFNDAIVELINQLPNKDRILRGSGKTGSGSSGGSTGSSQPVDLRNLTQARLKDPNVIAALKAQRGTTGITMGSSLQ
jgi:hypothetical protein